ncbi:MAG: hypothetical protein J4G18_05130 [Anaerolineae bacterium]|nr:hypothetical protein [Anaerolineae bacterium]
MAIAVKQIMLITRNVQFAIDVKRALEALGEYSMTTVADARNAMEQLRETPQQLVLLDTDNLTVSPAIMIEMIRSRQEDIAIVLAPDQPDVHELAKSYRAQGVVDVPVMARDLIPVLKRSLEADIGVAPQSPGDQADELSEDTIRLESLVGDALGEATGLNYTRRRLQASLDLLNPDPPTNPVNDAMELLVEPEDEGDTVRYRVVRVGDGGVQIRDVESDETPLSSASEFETLRDLAQRFGAQVGDRPVPAPAQRQSEVVPGDEDDLEDSAAFERMLNTVLDESTLLEDLTMESLFDTTRELPGAPGREAIPAWLRETEKFIREPNFLPDSLPPLSALEGAGETTIPASLAGNAHDDLSADSTVDSAVVEQKDSSAETSWGLLSSRDRDPYLAQLAVTMTRVMSDMTADATVLTQSNRIVAFSGNLSLEQFRAIRSCIADDWSAQDQQSRIRFIKVPKSGADYMLCSRGTVGGHSLTMIFAGGKQLQEIRRQGDRMLNALAGVTDGEAPPVEDEPGELISDSADSRTPIAFVWMVADPALLLRRSVAEQLVFWLEVQLNALNWRVHRLDVHQDFIYLHADAPGRASPESLIRTVMDRSRSIACSEDKALPDELWADAYLVLQPGRELSERELRNFLQFAR